MDLGSNVVSYHAELIAAGRLEAVIADLLSARQLPAWDVLRFGNLRSDGATAQAIKQVAATMKFPVTTYPGENSPYIQMSGDWEAYLLKLSKKMRANITRCQRSTQQAGESGMKWYEKGSDVAALLADILEVEGQSWKAQEATSIQSNGVELAYYQRLLPWLVDNGLTANVLYVKDKPCAYVLCAAWHGWIGQLKTSFSQDVRDAGFRVIQASIQRAFERGYTHYDFLGDAAPHKLRWTDQVQPHESVWVFARHLRGRMSAAVKKAVDGVRARRAPRPPPAA
jgi:CelD/BcsL family acetyltransferase involved in cellulose biosynthesis